MVHKVVWSLGGNVNLNEIKENCNDVERKYLEFGKKRWFRFFKKFSFVFFFVFAFIGFVLSFLTFIPHFFVYSIVFGLIAYFAFRNFYNGIIIDLVKYRVSKEFGWYYNPKKDKRTWYKLRQLIPEIFKKGNSKQYIDDQFYGSIYYGRKSFDFHSGIFHYAVSNKNNTHNYYRNFFAFKLNKKLNSRFFLYPEDFDSKVFNLFNKKEIDVESIEFNRIFAFKYQGKKSEKQFDIMKVIDPDMQIKLLELYNKIGAFNVLFDKDFVVFDFDGMILSNPKTDFSKDMKINKEDISFVKNYYIELVKIMQEIAGKLH